MDNSIYIALSRQLGLFRDMEHTANNLANQNSVGYKSTHLMFNEFLVDDGKKQKMAFANDISSFDNHEKGSVQITENTLDMMIGGKGYFTVETPNGPRYTRSGNFQLNSEGFLINTSGYYVLDTNNQRIQFSEENRDIVVGGAGNITVDGEDFTTLGIVEFENEYLLKRGPNQLYSYEDTPIPATDPRVAQGALEGSNVKAVLELTHMVDVSRSVASTARMIDGIYDMHRRMNQVYTQQT